MVNIVLCHSLKHLWISIYYGYSIEEDENKPKHINQDIEQLERLHELKEQGLITFEKLNLKDNHELLNNLEILGM